MGKESVFEFQEDGDEVFVVFFHLLDAFHTHVLWNVVDY